MYPNNNFYGSYYQPNHNVVIPSQRVNYAEQQPQGFSLKGRPVASIEEARASMIDFDGSVFYFPDMANKRIYSKQIGPDGNAILTMYEQKEIEDNYKDNNYVTKEELQNSINELRKFIEEQKIANSF